MRTSILSIGEHRGNQRIWLEGRWLEEAGFAAGTQVATSWEQGRIVIRPASNGDHKVAIRRKRPILDYNSSKIAEALGDANKIEVVCLKGKITITPAKTEAKRQRRSYDGTAGSIFSGGGLLDEAARLAGYTSSFGIEFDPGYADIWQQNHPGRMYCGCVSDLNHKRLPQVDLLTLGIPCEPFSRVRRSTKGKRRDENSPAFHELADMSFWALMVIEHTNPRNIVLEEVPDYITSEIGVVTLAVLRRMGYNVEHRIIDGTEYGALCMRKRAVIVAKSEGEIIWPEKFSAHRTLGDVLLSADDPRCEWFNRESKSWLFDHWDKQEAKGNNFANRGCDARYLRPDSPFVHAIKKRYFNQQGDNPVVVDVRPGREGWYRWLTITEVKRIMGLRDDYYLSDAKTTAGEVMGQGVLVDVFRQVIESCVPRAAKARRAA